MSGEPQRGDLRGRGASRAIHPPAPVGVVGCGTMGRILVSALWASGYSVMAYDRDPEAQASATASGATPAADLGSLGVGCPVVVLSLPGPAEVRAVTRELLDLPERPLFIVDTTTSDPATTQGLARLAQQRGVAFLDAPILGRPATAGRWAVPVGGDPGAVEGVRPVLEAFAHRIFHVGPPGAGHTVKLLNQMMFAVLNAATAEVMAVAPQLGIPPALFYEVVVSSGAATVSGLFREVGDKIARADFSPVFSVDLLCKDTDLALGMAQRAGAAPVLTSATRLLNHLARARGLGPQDSSALVQVYHALGASPDGGAD